MKLEDDWFLVFWHEILFCLAPWMPSKMLVKECWQPSYLAWGESSRQRKWWSWCQARFHRDTTSSNWSKSVIFFSVLIIQPNTLSSLLSKVHMSLFSAFRIEISYHTFLCSLSFSNKLMVPMNQNPCLFLNIMDMHVAMKGPLHTTCLLLPGFICWYLVSIKIKTSSSCRRTNFLLFAWLCMKIRISIHFCIANFFLFHKQ